VKKEVLIDRAPTIQEPTENGDVQGSLHDSILFELATDDESNHGVRTTNGSEADEPWHHFSNSASSTLSTSSGNS
jgi:hypothetical protein